MFAGFAGAAQLVACAVRLLRARAARSRVVLPLPAAKFDFAVRMIRERAGVRVCDIALLIKPEIPSSPHRPND